MSRLGRMLFLAVAATALALVVGGTACTRRGGNGAPPVPTATPITTYYVDPVRGSDSNSGSSTAPFRTIGKALSVVAKSTATGLTISLRSGAYTHASGEVFPLTIPTGVTLIGDNYGHGTSKGAFINGSGEDKALEAALGKPSSHTLFATLVVPGGKSFTFDKIYIGTNVPVTGGTYASVDVMGSMSASQDTFAAGARSPSMGGIVVPSGTLTCIACFVTGPDFAIKAFSLPAASMGPTVTLTGPGYSVIGGGDGIRTDGTATVTASAQVFQSRNTAYTDSLAVPSPSSSGSPAPTPTGSGSSSSGSGSVDFGYGAQGSLGGNTFVGSRITEISVVLGSVNVVARNNTWNVIGHGEQRTNAAGQYPKRRVFKAPVDGHNVKIAASAVGSSVVVGPPPAPTPTPSPTPYGSASPSPSASPTASPT